MNAKKVKTIPKFNTPIIETHAHLDYLKSGSVDEIVQESIDQGIEKILTITVTPDNQDEALQIAQKYDNVFCTQGVHPHEASSFNDSVENMIRENLKDKNVLAIGEIGLDYHYTRSPREVQQQVFERQLEIAEQSNLPVIFHTREAEEDTIAILKNHTSLLKRGGIFHCYSSNQELFEFALENGFYFGFNGIITFNASENVREILRQTPLDRIVLETDAPFLTPIPFRGKENAPKYIPLIVNKMSEVLEISAECLLNKIYQNTQKILF